ncbi:unnamed protein product [Danaus chrysippus]|uniref:(African queen) hypothetical protein n=1 Tax=Danaus chrysippus TaxID=151541 RepID=A0A8J2VPU5_9NEOP|nr:unnamed protein product [Danaus chrysippus]
MLYSLFQCYNAQKVPSIEPTNWTTCDEFLNGTSSFNVSSLFDIDWKIFYFWNTIDDESYTVRFSPATPVLVDRFKAELRGANESIDWDDAVMFMETGIDFSALYLKTTVPGKFRLISTLIFQTENIDILIFGLKLVPPGYLGIMNCKYRLCYALAPVDKMPADKNILPSAMTMGFRGDSNYSYLMKYDLHRMAQYNEDDADDDEQMEVDAALNIEEDD